MPRKHYLKRKRRLEKKKRRKELKNKKRKLSRIRRNKIENIRGQAVESISPTFDKSAFSENKDAGGATQKLDVFKKPMVKVFNKSAWKPDDGQE